MKDIKKQILDLLDAQRREYFDVFYTDDKEVTKRSTAEDIHINKADNKLVDDIITLVESSLLNELTDKIDEQKK